MCTNDWVSHCETNASWNLIMQNFSNQWWVKESSYIVTKSTHLNFLINIPKIQLPEAYTRDSLLYLRNIFHIIYYMTHAKDHCLINSVSSLCTCVFVHAGVKTSQFFHAPFTLQHTPQANQQKVSHFYRHFTFSSFLFQFRTKKHRTVRMLKG